MPVTVSSQPAVNICVLQLAFKPLLCHSHISQILSTYFSLRDKAHLSNACLLNVMDLFRDDCM